LKPNDNNQKTTDNENLKPLTTQHPLAIEATTTAHLKNCFCQASQLLRFALQIRPTAQHPL